MEGEREEEEDGGDGSEDDKGDFIKFDWFSCTFWIIVLSVRACVFTCVHSSTRAIEWDAGVVEEFEFCEVGCFEVACWKVEVDGAERHSPVGREGEREVEKEVVVEFDASKTSCSPKECKFYNTKMKFRSENNNITWTSEAN